MFHNDMRCNRWRNPTILIVGGFDLAQTARSIARGFEAIGWRAIHFPSRGRMRNHREQDDRNRRGESRVYDKDVLDRADCANEVEFAYRLLCAVRHHRPRILLWWTCKEDKPKRAITILRTEFPRLATVFQTQDDPWHAEQHPEYSDEFEFAVTCCRASEPAYTARGINPITLYPPPDDALCRAARVRDADRCDIAFAPGHLQGRDVWPTQYADRIDVARTLVRLGDFRGYGSWKDEADQIGLGADQFRGWREFEDLPSVYASASVNVNVHLVTDAGEYENKRGPETVCAGGFMLSDHIMGIDNIYRVRDCGYGPEDCEIDTWRTLPELETKVRWWLDHEDLRRAAASRARKRVLEIHGNRAFAQRLVTHIEEHGK